MDAESKSAVNALDSFPEECPHKEVDGRSWIDTASEIFSVIMMILWIPILVLSIILTAWIVGMSASNRHAIEGVLGKKNLIVAGACGISGCVVWIVGVFFPSQYELTGFMVLFASVVLWIVVMVESPWNAVSKLSQFSETIPSSKWVARIITALLISISLKVFLFTTVVLCVVLSEIFEPDEAADDTNDLNLASNAAPIPKIVQTQP
ncbi:hypothetical protein CPB84DRAFT_1804122, partial [Gymnopilus junonius]